MNTSPNIVWVSEDNELWVGVDEFFGVDKFLGMDEFLGVDEFFREWMNFCCG
jgi:hypothetical protein